MLLSPSTGSIITNNITAINIPVVLSSLLPVLLSSSSSSSSNSSCYTYANFNVFKNSVIKRKEKYPKKYTHNNTTNKDLLLYAQLFSPFLFTVCIG